jgi:transaldolase
MNDSSVSENPLRRLEAFGQSIWLDYLGRELFSSGRLRRYIEEDGLAGMTSNPSIFEEAILGGTLYDEDIRRLAGEGKTVAEIYDVLTQQDVRDAADLFRPLYDRLDGNDGFVSLEVNPHLAHDTKGTIEEARRLWSSVDRPNILIKVPATREGLPAIEQLTREGINVNVTLLFGLSRYRRVAEAYIAGLEARAAKGLPMTRVAGVASFFLSRIDTLVDSMIAPIVAAGGSKRDLARRVRGEIAIASAKTAYQIYHEIFGGERFRRLYRAEARVQRLLWASTSTKNPEYSDVKYVEPLIGPETINTLPAKTLDAYRDHGAPEATLERDTEAALRALEDLQRLGIAIDDVTRRLEEEGVEKFNKAYDKLIDSLGTHTAAHARSSR